MRWISAFLMLSFVVQLPAPNASGVSSGHMHMMVRDPEVHKKIWVETLGAQVVTSGTLEMLKLPGIFLILGKAETTEGSEGSSVDHFSFRAKDLPEPKRNWLLRESSLRETIPMRSSRSFPTK